MKIVMVSNYFNHHQRPLAEALNRLCGGQFRFIETTTMRQERKDLGYGFGDMPDYVLRSWEEDGCAQLIEEADVVIAGSAPETLLKGRIRAGKLIFRYSERPLKNGPEWGKYLPRLLRWHLRNPAGKPIYLLCASAFTAGDYAKFGLFRDRAYQWGYFPGTKTYGELPHKEPNSILWCGRFLDWKHPDDVLLAAKRLREEGYDFRLDFIGAGPMEQMLQDLTVAYGLTDHVRFLGSMKPDQVRTHMERSAIYLFTSDRNEGWGAVLNESMNSGCAVIASHAIGSVPFLLKDGENGLVYVSGNGDMLYEKMKYLLSHPQEQTRLGENACRTITECWNAETAARRLISLADKILSGERHPELYDNGVCSKAAVIHDDWYQDK